MTTPHTDRNSAASLDLDAIKARAAAATEGPWEEEWRPITGSPGYEVSNFGNVRSFYRAGNYKNKMADRGRLLKQNPNPAGYLGVAIKVDGSYRTRAVHRLVTEAFIGQCPEGLEVAHLNGDKTDNREVNLRYVTHAENESHKIVHGTTGAGELNSMAKLQGWQVAEIKYLASKSIPQGKIASLFDLSHKAVSAITSGSAWADEPVREDIPALVAEVERLRGQLTDIVSVLSVALGGEW